MYEDKLGFLFLDYASINIFWFPFFVGALCCRLRDDVRTLLVVLERTRWFVVVCLFNIIYQESTTRLSRVPSERRLSMANDHGKLIPVCGAPHGLINVCRRWADHDLNNLDRMVVAVRCCARAVSYRSYPANIVPLPGTRVYAQQPCHSYRSHLASMI